MRQFLRTVGVFAKIFGGLALLSLMTWGALEGAKGAGAVSMMLFLLGILSRVTTIMFIAKQVAAAALRLVHSVLRRAQRLDLRHRRENGAITRKRPARRASGEDDEPAIVYGVAWA